jgi:hypothetical protein
MYQYAYVHRYSERDMGSLGEYTIAKSSSSDINNIKWTKKNQDNAEKPRNKKEKMRKTSPSNIIYTDEAEKPTVEKIFKIEVEDNESKKNKTEKKVKTASTSNSKIKYSFSRRGR